MALTSYEEKAYQETEAYFREPEGGLLGRFSRSLFKPVETVSERLIPARVLEMAGDGVEGALKGIAYVSDRTLSIDRVLAEARRHVEVDSLAELRQRELRVLDKVAEGTAREHEMIALLEGAGCGAGGLALIAADIPLLFGVALRVVRLVGASYGFDPFAPGEGVIAYKIFELACGGTRDRYAQLLELETLSDELDGLEPAKRAEKAAVLAGLIVSREAVKRIVSMLFSRKLFQAVPIAGAAVGAGFNFMFVQDVGEVARQVFRRRWLADKRRAQGGSVEV